MGGGGCYDFNFEEVISYHMDKVGKAGLDIEEIKKVKKLSSKKKGGKQNRGSGGER